MELGEACKVVTTAYKSEPWFGAAFRESILSALCDFNETQHSPMLYVMASKIAERIFDLSETQDSIIKRSLENHQTVKDDRTILDSGERREFETGAVRDIQTGKGRCDLLPLMQVAETIGLIGEPDEVIKMISNYQTEGGVEFLKLAIKTFLRKCGWSIPYAMLEVSKHFEAGCAKYGERNWEKGIPEHCYIDSAVRHYLKWLDGMTDEPHDRAVVWNLLCLWWTHENVNTRVVHRDDD